jgi:uncharacterized membrane protein HdeD (DUF308 family)
MLDNLRLSFGILSLLVGLVLLYEGTSSSRVIQPPTLVAGAVFISLGFISVWFVAKNWLEMRKYFKNDRG